MHRRREEEKIGGGIAQWVERPTEKSGAVLTRVRVPDAARGFLPEPASSVECLTLSVQPRVCIRKYQDRGSRQKSQTLTATPLFGHTKIQHTLIGMGSAALAAAVPYPGKATRISCKAQISTVKKSFFHFKSDNSNTAACYALIFG